MDAAEALADLTELSSQIRQAAIVGSDGEIVAIDVRRRRPRATVRRARATLARGAETAGETRGLTPLAQLEAATLDGSVFLVRGDGRDRGDDGAGADGRPRFYDLKHCLRELGRARRRNSRPA